MNTLASLARRYYPELDGSELRRVCSATIAYLLKTADDSREASNDLSRTIRDIGGRRSERTRDYRRDVYADGYIIKNLKLWLWWMAWHKLRPKAARGAMADFDVRPEDWPLAWLAMTDRQLRARLDEMASIYKAHTLAEFDDMVQRGVDAADKAIRSRARTKLRFLELTRFITSDDLLGELRYHAVLGVTRQYPKIESDKHMANLAGLCARYGGDALIKYHTHPDRQFLSQNADRTWDSLIMSVDAGDDADDYVSSVDRDDLHEVRMPSSDTDVQDDLSAMYIESAVSRYRGRKRTFAALMLGVENGEFSEYLAGYGLPANHIVFDEAAADAGGGSKLFDRYVRHAADWLGVPEKAAWRFLREFGSSLRDG